MIKINDGYVLNNDNLNKLMQHYLANAEKFMLEAAKAVQKDMSNELYRASELQIKMADVVARAMR